MTSHTGAQVAGPADSTLRFKNCSMAFGTGSAAARDTLTLGRATVAQVLVSFSESQENLGGTRATMSWRR